jgi:O-antigen polymerase
MVSMPSWLSTFKDSIKPVELFIILIFLIAPFYYQPNLGGVGLMIPSNITVWMAVTLFLAYTYYRVVNQSIFVIPKHFLWVLAFPILATLSGFITGVNEPITWFFRLLFIWAGIAFLAGLFQFKLSRLDKDKLLFYIVISGLFHGIVGLLQLFQPEGITFFLPSIEPKRIATGMFQQNNIHAVYQATVIMVAWYLMGRPFVKVRFLY